MQPPPTHVYYEDIRWKGGEENEVNFVFAA